MKNDKYAFKSSTDILQFDTVPVKASSADLFFHDREELDAFLFGYDRPFKLMADMLEKLDISKKTPLEDLDYLHMDKLNCIDCLYDLYVLRIPQVNVDGADRLERFGIFAYIDDDLVGIMSGYKARSFDIVTFFKEITETLCKSVCARSWRYLAERTFPALKNAFDLADQEMTPALQDEILNRVKEYVESGSTNDHSCVLVSRLFVEKDTRKCGILSHLIAALEVVYESDYAGVFYLAPKRHSPYYDEYDIALNAEIASSYGMDVVGEERPLAVRLHTKQAVA